MNHLDDGYVILYITAGKYLSINKSTIEDEQMPQMDYRNHNIHTSANGFATHISCLISSSNVPKYKTQYSGLHHRSWVNMARNLLPLRLWWKREDKRFFFLKLKTIVMYRLFNKSFTWIEFFLPISWYKDDFKRP